jgi:transcriptional regulator with GAF, ATPase, and Fis domain
MPTADVTRSAGVDPGEGSRGARLALIVAHSPDAELRRREAVPLEGPMTLGRRDGAGCELSIDDGRISRRHATLRPRADGRGVEVVDHDSRNAASALAGAGSVLRLGDTVFVLGALPWRSPATPPAGFVGRSARMLDVLWNCETAAGSALPVLLLGETGTGKEVVARYVHAASARPGRLVTVNCAAIPRELAEAFLFGHTRGAFTGAVGDRRGAFVEAHGGTLFLDEIGELAPDVQAKLLRVLERGELAAVGATTPTAVDVRVIAATNAELASDVESGRFRRDLYARVAGVVARLPPLRARREDIPLLARRFLDELGTRAAFSAGFVELLLVRPWTMNVRELRTAMHRLSLAAGGAGELHASHLLAVLDDTAAAPVAPAEDEPAIPPRSEIVALLEKHGGNVAELARHYGKHRKQVYRWLERHNLSGDDFRTS